MYLLNFISTLQVLLQILIKYRKMSEKEGILGEIPFLSFPKPAVKVTPTINSPAPSEHNLERGSKDHLEAAADAPKNLEVKSVTGSVDEGIFLSVCVQKYFQKRFRATDSLL